MGAEEEPKFLIDYCLTAALPQHLLHHRGIDAIRTDAVLAPDAEDAAVLALACAQGRVIVTENAEDFRALARNNPRHPGLVILPGGVGKAAQIALTTAAVDRMLHDIEAGRHPSGHVYEVASDGAIRRRRLPKT